MRIQVIGGPWDGLDARAGEVFVWIGSRGDKGIVYAEPGPGRALYRRLSLGGDYYLYAGDTHWQCGGCGGYMQKVEGGSESTACYLCGTAPVRTV